MQNRDFYLKVWDICWYISEIFIKNANQQVGWHCVDFLTTEMALPQAVKHRRLAHSSNWPFAFIRVHSRFKKGSAPQGRVALPGNSGPFGESSLPILCPPGDDSKRREARLTGLTPIVHPSLRPPGDYKKRREARLTGFEPVTVRLEGGCSIQLSYRRCWGDC